MAVISEQRSGGSEGTEIAMPKSGRRTFQEEEIQSPRAKMSSIYSKNSKFSVARIE